MNKSLLAAVACATSFSCSFADDLDAEALAICKEQSKPIVQCGEFYYISDTKWFPAVGDFTQMKGIKFTIHANQITEADKLNGLEWKGSIGAISDPDITRVYRRPMVGKPKAWEEWKMKRYATTRCFLKKINGKWEVASRNYWGRHLDFSCADIPSG